MRNMYWINPNKKVGSWFSNKTRTRFSIKF